MVEEQSVWHEVTSIQNDWGQHEEEEDIWGEGGGRVLRGEEEEEPDDDTDNNEETTLREDMVKLRRHVESNFCQGGNKNPQSNDEGYLDPLELDMEDVVLVLWVLVHRGVVTQALLPLLSMTTMVIL